MGEFGLAIGLLSLLIWAGLLAGWGQFWRCDQRLETEDPVSSPSPERFPAICAVIPARNEADMLPLSLPSLLQQDYPGELRIVLVDDQSSDGTGAIAQQLAAQSGNADRLTVLSAEPLPAGWSGKLWAMEQGIRKAESYAPDYVLLTDADIYHDPANLRRLVARVLDHNLEMASVMVRLRCDSFWETLLIPAFVFFFQQLYPFPWVNNPRRKMAAAAGGCILIRRTTLERIGGMEPIRQTLIDDCGLAQIVKLGVEPQSQAGPSGEYGRIWLGLSDRTRSLRPYDSLKTIWDMVARTAFTQLNYSPLLLLGTIVGMVLVYLVSPIALGAGLLSGLWGVALVGGLGWLLMTIAYWPTVRFYRCSPIYALCLPVIGLLYTLMTIDSALRHWRGQGGAWKGRVYPA